MVIFRFLCQNGLKVELHTFAVHKILMEHYKGRYQVNLQEKINHNQTFSEFSETEAINLKKVASFFSRYNPFSSWPSAAQDTYFYY